MISTISFKMNGTTLLQGRHACMGDVHTDPLFFLFFMEVAWLLESYFKETIRAK